jgi:hypothetical protein
LVYGIVRALLERSRQPLFALGISALVGLGLAMPKLAAVADAMRRAPRYIESSEAIGWPELWTMMTSRVQEYGKWPMHVPKYNWHEWGLYVGFVGAVMLLIGLHARGRREKAALAAALVLLSLGFGAFHRFAPWSLLHRLPLFSSQHVPSRFFYPMLLLAGLATAAALGRWLEPRLLRFRWLDPLLLGVVALYGVDVAHVASRAFEQSFWLRAPDRISRLGMFEHHLGAPVRYLRADWATPMYLSMLANTGVIQCYGVDPGFAGIGARAADAEGYRGRVFVEAGPGEAELAGWSPNRARVQVRGAQAGARVVYDMNWDPSWRAAELPAENDHEAVAGRLPVGASELIFRYVPRTLRWSVPICVLTLLACAWALVEQRRSGRGSAAWRWPASAPGDPGPDPRAARGTQL